MSDLRFSRSVPTILRSVAIAAGVDLPPGADPLRPIAALVPLARAGPTDVAVFLDAIAPDDLRSTRAAACLVRADHRGLVPARTVALVTDHPHDAARRVAALLRADVSRIAAGDGTRGIDPTALVHRLAQIEDGVEIDAGAIIGARAEIGAGTFIGAQCVVGRGVRIGRGCALAFHASLTHALVGDRVEIGPGVRIGQADVPAPAEMLGDARPPLPSLGRVIIQNDAVIGANAVVARGRLRDTVIGEGSRIEACASVPGDTVVWFHGRFAEGPD